MIKTAGYPAWRNESSLENSFVNHLRETQWEIVGIYRKFVFAKSSKCESVHCFMLINLSNKSSKDNIFIFKLIREHMNYLYKVFFYADDFMSDLKIDKSINKYTIVILTTLKKEFAIHTPYYKDNKLTSSSQRERFIKAYKILCKKIGFWTYYPRNLTEFHNSFIFPDNSVGNSKNIAMCLGELSYQICQTEITIVERIDDSNKEQTEKLEMSIISHDNKVAERMEKQTKELKRNPIILNMIFNVMASIIYGFSYEFILHSNSNISFWLPFVILSCFNIGFWLVYHLVKSRKELKKSLLNFLDNYFCYELK